MYNVHVHHNALSTLLQHIVQGMPRVNVPDVCTEAPLYGQAFCASHCSFLKEHAPGVPTGLREFLQYCGVASINRYS